MIIVRIIFTAKYEEKHAFWSLPFATDFILAVWNPKSETALKTATKDIPHIIMRIGPRHSGS